MLHPGLHADLAHHHQRALEQSAARARLGATARQSLPSAPDVVERARLGAGRLLIGWGARLCAPVHSALPVALPRPAPPVALGYAGGWQPVPLVSDGAGIRAVAPATFVYYGFVTVGPQGITRAEYLTPLAHPLARRRSESEKWG